MSKPATATAAAAIQRSTKHATFTIERVYDASPTRVFAAFADEGAKRKWFGGPEEWVAKGRSFDFRVGGREYMSAGPADGQQHVFDAHYYEIIPDERIVYAYEMYLDTTRISVSLTTIELAPAGVGKTRLTFTEQGVFLDDFDGAKGREEGSRWLLDKLGAALR